MLLERLIAVGERLVTDAEVLQEILHRYTAINKREAIEPALRVTLDVVDEVFAVEVQFAGSVSTSHKVSPLCWERLRIRNIRPFDKTPAELKGKSVE